MFSLPLASVFRFAANSMDGYWVWHHSKFIINLLEIYYRAQDSRDYKTAFILERHIFTFVSFRYTKSVISAETPSFYIRYFERYPSPPLAGPGPKNIVLAMCDLWWYSQRLRRINALKRGTYPSLPKAIIRSPWHNNCSGNSTWEDVS